MSEKVTFQELIDSIAEQTDNSKKFTHDFLKDLVSVINSGLDDDGKVNIAGFGKFELRQMEEREGYNPQTGDNMTIPAHNKVVFKPYKDLRELVNVPFAHLEAEIIEEQQEEESSEQQAGTAAPPTDADSGAGSEPADTPQRPGKGEEPPFEISPSESGEDPFTFEAEEDKDKDASDIVEYRASEETEEDSEETEQEPEHPESATVLDRYLAGTEELGDEGEPAGSEDSDSSERDSEEEAVSDETEAKKHETVSSAGDSAPDQEGDESVDEKVGSAESVSDTGSDAEEAEAYLTDEPEPDEEAASPAPFVLPGAISSRRSLPSAVWWAAALILVVLIIGVGYFILGNGEEKESPSLAATQSQQVTEQPQTARENQQPASEPQNGEPTDETAEQQPSTPSTSGESRTTATPSEPSQDDPQVVTINRGQSLWSIARNNYEDPYLWPWIYDANKSVIGNPNIIIEGQTLSIPMPDEPDYGLSNTDSLEVAMGYVTTYRWYKENGHDRAKFYLWAARTYDREIFDHISQPIDEEDLAFANRVR